MSKKRPFFELMDFTKGLNSLADKGNVLPQELTAAINVDVLTRGGFTKRCGTEVAKTYTATSINRIIPYNDEVYVCYGTSMVRWSDNAVIKNDFNNTAFDYVTLQGKLYLVNGNSYYVYDGTTLAEVTADAGDLYVANIKRCKYIERRGERFYASGDTQNPEAVYVSEAINPKKWLYSITCKNDVTGLIEFHRAMLCGQKEHVQAWTGYDPQTDMALADVSVTKGPYLGRTFVRVGNYVGYLANDGVYILAGTDDYNINSVNVSKNILPIIQSLTNLEKAVSVYHDGKYMIACCNDGTGKNNMVLVANVLLSYLNENNELQFPWTVYTGWNVNEWFKQNNDLFYGSSVNGKIYKLDSALYNDDGVAISMYVKTKELAIENRFLLKKFKTIFVAARQYEESSTCNITIRVDSHTQGFYSYNLCFNETVIDDSTVLGQGALLGWLDNITQEIKSFQSTKGHRIEFTFSNNRAGEPVTIYGIGGIYKHSKYRGSDFAVQQAVPIELFPPALSAIGGARPASVTV